MTTSLPAGQELLRAVSEVAEIPEGPLDLRDLGPVVWDVIAQRARGPFRGAEWTCVLQHRIPAAARCPPVDDMAAAQLDRLLDAYVEELNTKMAKML
jgi:hypothetical protein